MREQVHNNWIRRDEEPSTPKKKSGINQGAGDSENQVRLNYNVNRNIAKRRRRVTQRRKPGATCNFKLKSLASS